MISPLKKKLTAIVLCLSVLLIPRHAKGQYIGPTKGQVTGIIIGIVAVGAAIGIGIYLVLHRQASITGCAADGGSGLNLVSEADHQTYALSGDIAAIKPGERVRISGKKSSAAGKHMFVVRKLAKDYGACTAAAMISSGAHDGSSPAVVSDALDP